MINKTLIRIALKIFSLLAIVAYGSFFYEFICRAVDIGETGVPQSHFYDTDNWGLYVIAGLLCLDRITTVVKALAKETE